ncbi:MAG TPA: OmpH family outer membrane protein [Planctomycetota bacterium]|nr:OmpH family outer membrane protein [Planctomycetota bacterium]
MNPKKILATLVAAAALQSAVLAQQPAQEDGKGHFKLGVVNLKICFEKENYERIKEIDTELQKKSDEYLRKLSDIEKKMVELKEQIDSLPRESPLRAEKMLQYRRAETDRKFEQEYGRTKYLEYYSDKKIEIYNEVRKVVAMIALEQKYDLILRVEAPMLEEQDPETVTQRINNRVVLYYHENVDITKLVLKKLNDEWAKTKASASVAQEWECPKCHKKNKASDAACTATKDCTGKKP